MRTRARPRPGRDPLQEDAEARILAIANPTTDLAAAEREVAAIAALAGDHGKFKIAVDVLARGDATRANFLARLTRGDYDIVHFAGHAGFDPTEPEASALRLADGFVTADELLALDWKAPPYLVFNSACESGRAAGGAGWCLIKDRPTGWPRRSWPAARPPTPATSGLSPTTGPASSQRPSTPPCSAGERRPRIHGGPPAHGPDPGPDRRPLRVQRRAVRRRGLGQAPRSCHRRLEYPNLPIRPPARNRAGGFLLPRVFRLPKFPAHRESVPRLWDIARGRLVTVEQTAIRRTLLP